MAAAEHTPKNLSVLLERLDQLIALFNKKGMDLPAGLFDRKTQFVLNGAAYETLLGRSPNDPLILMLSRGPSGYRFIAKALQHAVPDATLERGEPMWDASASESRLDLWLSGHLRGAGDPINAVIHFALTVGPQGCVDKAEAILDEPTLERLREARYRS
jgi:hypothetical protein